MKWLSIAVLFLACDPLAPGADHLVGSDNSEPDTTVIRGWCFPPACYPDPTPPTRPARNGEAVN